MNIENILDLKLEKQAQMYLKLFFQILEEISLSFKLEIKNFVSEKQYHTYKTYKKMLKN